MKSKKSMTMVNMIIVLAGLIILILVVVPLVWKPIKTSLNITETEVPGVVKEGEEGRVIQSNPKYLTIMKVTVPGKEEPIIGTPSGLNLGDWSPSKTEIDDNNRYIVIHFDKELKDHNIPSTHYAVYTNGWNAYIPSKEADWESGPDPGFGSVSIDNKQYRNRASLRDGYYYIIRFYPDKEFETEDGKTFKINPTTATIKFEVN